MQESSPSRALSLRFLNSRRQGEPLENEARRVSLWLCSPATQDKTRSPVHPLPHHSSATTAKSRAKKTSGNYSCSISLCDNPWGQQTPFPFGLPPFPLQTPGYTFLPTPEIHHHLHPSHPHPAVSNLSPGATDRNKLANTPDRE